MDFNVSTGYEFASTSTTPAATNDANESITQRIVFVPFLLIQITITLASNGILLLMIGRSFKSSTSLNIFLLSISIFNLVTVVNQVSLAVYVLQRDVTKFPHQLCHLMSIIKSSTTVGITLLHLFISHHRLKIAKSPLMRQNTRKQAWLLGAIVWAIACAVAIFECVLHIGNDEYSNSENIQTCVWPGINKCTTRLSLYVNSIVDVCMQPEYIVSGITYYFYIKAGKKLKDNKVEKEAVVLQITAMKTMTKEPILLFLLSIGILTTNSPLVLACINKKFKDHVKLVLVLVSVWFLRSGSPEVSSSNYGQLFSPPAQEPFKTSPVNKFPSLLYHGACMLIKS